MAMVNIVPCEICLKAVDRRKKLAICDACIKREKLKNKLWRTTCNTTTATVGPFGKMIAAKKKLIRSLKAALT